MNFTKLIILTTIALLLSASHATAGIIFNNQTDFENSVTNTIVDDYSNADYKIINTNLEMSSVLGETAYRSTEFVDLNLVDPLDFYCAGCNGSFFLDFTSTSIGNYEGVYGVGFNYFNFVPSTFYALITYGNGSTESILLDEAPFLNRFEAFVGITSELKISYISIGLEDGDNTSVGNVGIDNLTIGTSIPVPEPSTFIIFVLGMIGLASRRFKKKY